MKYGYVSYYNLYKPTSFFDSGDVSCSIGTGGSGSTTLIKALPVNRYNLIPLAVSVQIGGTVASGETISVDIKATLEDGTVQTLLSVTTTGTTKAIQAGTEILLNLGVENKRVVMMEALVSSSATTTNATVSVRVIGVYG